MNSKNSKKIGLFTLICIATGNVIGAGIITTTGLAIAQTGRSVWISYGLAVLFGFLWMYPALCFASCARHTGGAYAMASVLMGPVWGGVYSLVWLPMFLMVGMLTSAFGLYVSSILPGVPPVVAAVVGGTIFFVFNLMGVKSMSRLQTPMTIFLFGCLLCFAVVGFFHVDSNALALTSEGYFMNGMGGVLDGMMLLIFSTSGQALVSSLSWEAEKSRKNIPLAIMITTGIIMVLYCTVSFVAGNVLPVSEVAGQPLTFVAKILFPGILFLVFIVGGPIMALATSINASYNTMCAPPLGAIRNGWLPESFGKTNKHGVPWILYTVMYLVSVIPVLFGVNLNTLTAYCVLTMRTGAVILLIAGYFLPTKLKEPWEKSWMHCPNWLFYTINTLGLVTNIAAMISSLRTLNGTVFAINLGIELALAGYAIYRYKAKKTTEANYQIAYED